MGAGVFLRSFLPLSPDAEPWCLAGWQKKLSRAEGVTIPFGRVLTLRAGGPCCGPDPQHHTEVLVAVLTCNPSTRGWHQRSRGSLSCRVAERHKTLPQKGGGTGGGAQKSYLDQSCLFFPPSNA